MHATLKTFIVMVGLSSVQPNDQMGKAFNADGSVQDIYRNYFDSLAKNKAMDTRTYRGKLEQETVKEQEVFDTMKEEIQSARHRNSKPRHHGTGGRNAVSKREAPTDENDGLFLFHQSSNSPTTTPASQRAEGSVHDQYVRLYGNDVNTTGIWPMIREIKDNRTALKAYCSIAYKTRYPYRVVFFGDLTLESYPLAFPGTNYKTIQADILICETAEGFLVLHKGLRDECAFQVLKVDVMGPRVFHLRHHLCWMPNEFNLK